MSIADRVKDSTTTPGTGAITLAQVTQAGFQLFAVAFSSTSTVTYCISSRTTADWEVGNGVFTPPASLTRSPTSSSNGGSLVTFGSEVKDVFVTQSASNINKQLSADDISFSATIPLTGQGIRYMPTQSVTGPLAFIVAASPLKNSHVYLRLIADGSNVPTFAGLKEWGGSLGYDNRAGYANQISFFNDGTDNFYSISQAVGATATPVAATGVTLAGPTSGVASTASTNFTVGVTPVGGTITGTVVITPSDAAGGGTFTPTSVSLTTAAPTNTFTYTPNATVATRTISITNNGALANPSSISYNVTASATVSGAPTIGTATATGSTTATVAFTAPASNGGSAITSYTATSSPTGITGTLTQAGSGTITVSGLTASTAYTFTVTATNGVGTSAASAASNSVTTSAAASLLLDSVGASMAAYSVARRLKTTYTGPLIAVYGTSQVDIGYDASGNLDQTAINAAATAQGALKLAKIYDQSGNVRHLTNASAGNYWGFANASGVVTSLLGGKPAWNPQNYAPSVLASATGGATASAAVVAGLTTQISGAGIVSIVGGTSTDPLYLPSATAGALAGRWASVASTTLKVNNVVATSMPTTGPSSLYSEGASQTATAVRLGADSGAAAGYNGFISEAILFTAALSSADQTTVYNSQKAYFGTP